MIEALRIARGVLRSLRIYYFGRHDRSAMDRLYEQFVKPGDLVFDIGSHVGDRIGAFRRIGARVVACEPNPPLVKTLRLIYGRDAQVTIEPLAVGAAAGTIEMKINIDNPTVSTASKDFLKASEGAAGWEGQNWDKSITVGMTTLDTLIARHGMPAFIKIDVEGFEAEALGGLTQPVPALSFEFTTIQRDVAQACLARCVELGCTRYNAALGESQQMVHDDWQSADDIGRWLTALPMGANSGDIYATRHPEVRAERASANRHRRFADVRLRFRTSEIDRGDGVCCHPSRPTFGRHLRMTAVAVCAVLIAAPALAADDVAVDVQNASTPTLCAETDNVYVKLTSPEVRRFTIEAVHPNYIGTIVVDRSAFDLHNCPELKAAPIITEQPKRVTIFETPELQLVGLTIPNFWRKNIVPVRVGDRVEAGVQLLQVWVRTQDRAEEVLVLYPQDGYWRARPLPPRNLNWSAYGTSFLIGPIEQDQRPFVAIKEVVFDPVTKTFRLSFTRGGSASLRVETLDVEHQVLDVTLDPPAGGDLPFAALRSMYVTEINNDVAHLGWRLKGAPSWERTPIMDFKRASAVEVWAGRVVPSRHNTSAPDMVMRDFAH